MEVRCRHRGVWFLDGVVLEVVTKYEPKKMADDTEVVLIPGSMHVQFDEGRLRKWVSPLDVTDFLRPLLDASGACFA